MILALLLACPGPSPKDSGTFTFTFTGSTTTESRPQRTDDTGVPDTGPYAALFYDGALTGDGQTLESGHYGLGMYRYNRRTNHSDLNQPLCQTWVKLVAGDPIDARCDQCTYTYSLIGTEGGSSTGDACSKLKDAGIRVADQSSVDGYFVGFSFGLGWVPQFQKYNFPAIMQYQFDYPEYGWFLFAYDYDSYNRGPNGKVTGGNGSFTWIRPLRDRNNVYELYYDY